MEIFLLKTDGAHAGPFSVDQTKAMLEAGKLTPETPYWRAGMEGWRPVRELFACGSSGAQSSPRRQLDGDILEHLTQAPLINGASNGCLSKVVMGVDSIRQGRLDRARELFEASLAENHAVASGWLGLAYFEAMSVGDRRGIPARLESFLTNARQYCPATEIIHDSSAQLLVVASLKAKVSAHGSYSSYSRLLADATIHSRASSAAAARRNGSILIGTTAAVLASRSTSAFSKVIGYSVASQSAFRAVDGHVQSHLSRIQANEHIGAAVASHMEGRAAAACAMECLRELHRLSGRCGSFTQGVVTLCVRQVAETLAVAWQIELQSISMHLRTIAGQLYDPAFVANHPEGTEMVISFTKFIHDIGISELPVCRSVETLFRDLNHWHFDPERQRAQRRAIMGQRLRKVLGIFLCLLAVAIWVCSVSLPVFNGPDVPPYIVPACLVGAMVCFAVGLIRIWTSSSGGLPLDKAVDERLAALWNAFKSAGSGPALFGSGTPLSR